MLKKTGVLALGLSFLLWDKLARSSARATVSPSSSAGVRSPCCAPDAGYVVCGGPGCAAPDKPTGVGSVTRSTEVSVSVGKKNKKHKLVEVPVSEEMDNETFLLHLEHRHRAEAKIEDYTKTHGVESWIGVYRAFHDRLHRIAIPGQHDHVHTHEDEEIDGQWG